MVRAEVSQGLRHAGNDLDGLLSNGAGKAVNGLAQRGRERIRLPRGLAHEVADAVVVDGLRPVRVDRAHLELIEAPPSDRADRQATWCPHGRHFPRRSLSAIASPERR